MAVTQFEWKEIKEEAGSFLLELLFLDMLRLIC